VTLANAANVFTGAVSISALNAVSIIDNTNLLLGNVSVGTGTFTAATAAANQSIAQSTGSTLRIFGNTSFTVSGTGAIAIDKTGNNFGALTLAAGAGPVILTEAGTLNLKGLTGSGGAMLTSEAGNIINSGGITTSGGSLLFTASNGSIDLSNSANNGTGSSSVRLISKGDSTIFNAGGLQLAGGTAVGGVLSVSTTNAAISSTGTVLVTGNASFNAGTGSITLTDSNNQFGALTLRGGTVSVNERTTMNLRNSVVTGPALLTTSGDFITSGGNSFASTLGITAGGAIKPSTGGLDVLSQLTVSATGTKDLSALNYLTDLHSITPVYAGTGTNVKSQGEP